MKDNTSTEQRTGYAAGKSWLESTNETERAELAVIFSAGLLSVHLSADEFPSLTSHLGRSRLADGGYVDFGASAWLSGFRDAVIEDLGFEPG